MIDYGALGTVKVSRAESEVDVSTQMLRRLLALLIARAGQLMSPAMIADELWNADPPVTSRKTVQVYIHKLRRLLGDDGRITHSAMGYTLLAHRGERDCDRFEQLLDQAATESDPAAISKTLRRALGMWRGPAYDGIDDMPSVTAERERLEGRRLTAFEDRITADLQLGLHSTVVDEVAAAVSVHPYRERLRGQLMLALYRSGRQADALNAFRQAREQLATELGIEPGPELQALHQQILNNDPGLTAPARPKPPAHHLRFLPRDISDFIGRAEALAQLSALRDVRAAVVISAIDGTAGIGKTTLAVHWAHHVADDYPDGQLYLNLRGFDPSGSVVQPGDALRSLLEALQVPADHIPRDLQARAGLYRSLLESRRMVVVLDNARDAKQVRPLLPGCTSCLVLVTSRNQLTGLVATDGAYPVSLDLLDAAESWELLAARLGHERLRTDPEATDEILARCAGLPLALAIVAAGAATQPRRPLAYFATQLREAQGSLHAFANSDDTATDVRAVFSWSYQALSPSAARLFRLLGLHPGPDVSAGAAASLAGHPVEAELAELVGARLLMSSTPDRYSFHDLLRAYAAELALAIDADHDRAAATRRMLDHYVHTAHAADRVLAPARDLVILPTAEPGVRPDTFGDPLAWFTAEHSVLLAMTRHAAATGHDASVGRLSWVLGIFLNRQGHWHDWAEVQDAGVAAYLRLGDIEGQAVTRMNLARAYTRIGSFDLAEPQFRQALDLYESLADNIGLGHANLNLGWMCDQQGERYPEALGFAVRASEHYRIAAHQVGQANALNLAGWCQAQLGGYTDAVRHCEQALALQIEIGDRRAQANTWDSLGFAQHRLGNHGEAVRCYGHAIAIQREVGERYQTADTLIHLAEVLDAADRRAEAGDALREAWQICEDLGHPDAAKIQARLDERAA